ncbi:MAG: tRNA (cytidine(34)-2'-O)-methyltransferase [Granulosicoccaceae bacterium]
MFKVVLHNPQIPPNTGNLIRLCANTGFELHLVEPLGFSLDEKSVRRAGLDYREAARVQVHKNIHDCLSAVAGNGEKVYACSTKGTMSYADPTYKPGDVLLMGSETEGLPAGLMQSDVVDHIIRIPMQAGSRSLNLSNAAAIIAFEAWRQNDFGL